VPIRGKNSTDEEKQYTDSVITTCQTTATPGTTGAYIGATCCLHRRLRNRYKLMRTPWSAGTAPFIKFDQWTPSPIPSSSVDHTSSPLTKPWSRVENLEMHKVFPSAHNGCSAVEGVTDCFHITVRSDNNNTDRRKTNTFILTFNSNTAPAHINIGYLRVKVD